MNPSILFRHGAVALAIVALLCLSTPGSAADKDKMTKANYNRIKVGTTTYDQVVELLGKPDSNADQGDMKLAGWATPTQAITIEFDKGVVKKKNSTGLK